jgi:hypothetical protein
MANDEHVALLKEGVAAWNARHVENAEIVPSRVANRGSRPPLARRQGQFGFVCRPGSFQSCVILGRHDPTRDCDLRVDNSAV